MPEECGFVVPATGSALGLALKEGHPTIQLPSSGREDGPSHGSLRQVLAPWSPDSRNRTRPSDRDFHNLLAHAHDSPLKYPTNPSTHTRPTKPPINHATTTERRTFEETKQNDGPPQVSLKRRTSNDDKAEVKPATDFDFETIGPLSMKPGVAAVMHRGGGQKNKRFRSHARRSRGHAYAKTIKPIQPGSKHGFRPPDWHVDKNNPVYLDVSSLPGGVQTEIPPESVPHLHGKEDQTAGAKVIKGPSSDVKGEEENIQRKETTQRTNKESTDQPTTPAVTLEANAGPNNTQTTNTENKPRDRVDHTRWAVADTETLISTQLAGRSSSEPDALLTSSKNQNTTTIQRSATDPGPQRSAAPGAGRNPKAANPSSKVPPVDQFNDRRQRWRKEERRRQFADRQFAERQRRLGGGHVAGGSINYHGRRSSSREGRAMRQPAPEIYAKQSSQTSQMTMFNAVHNDDVRQVTKMITVQGVSPDVKLISGDDPRATNSGSYWTPLMYAARKGRQATVCQLLQLGANPNLAQPNGWTALHHAAWKGHHVVVDMLLRNRAIDVSARAQGWMPLHVAAKQGHLECVKVLMIHPINPADPYALSEAPGPSFGLTAMDLAMGDGNHEIVMFMRGFLENLSRSQVPVSFDFLDYEQEAEGVYQPNPSTRAALRQSMAEGLSTQKSQQRTNPLTKHPGQPQYIENPPIAG